MRLGLTVMTKSKSSGCWVHISAVQYLSCPSSELDVDPDPAVSLPLDVLDCAGVIFVIWNLDPPPFPALGGVSRDDLP